MASTILVDDLQDSGGNSYLSSNGSGTVTIGNSALKNTPAFNVFLALQLVFLILHLLN